ncbi:cupin domain-containing protein [Caulobacter sp. RL271]|jgi:quercetin dioxygenase-like cupin family protein|uniref:Cupin domain-containing protein n=1 Tax=Caulobacter segnis TaxID=88688 RepID=A0ABY4ZQ14_9CAUL|nr:cupin domain-containing protein [Caulobacter segnis]USQ94801.1 cupin domain-containing protein [Caulobacter segnis]
MITKRDLAIAAGAAVLTLAGVAVAQAPKPALLGPSVWRWDEIKFHDTDVGAYAQLVRAPTATLDELEMHVTTLKPGLSSHAPHTHPNEELVIIREGEVEVLSDGVWKKVGPGGVVFNASNSPHALRNVGPGNAVYHVINWKSAK